MANHKNVNDGDIKARIQSLLRYAPDREGGSGRQGNKRKARDVVEKEKEREHCNESGKKKRLYFDETDDESN